MVYRPYELENLLWPTCIVFFELSMADDECAVTIFHTLMLLNSHRSAFDTAKPPKIAKHRPRTQPPSSDANAFLSYSAIAAIDIFHNPIQPFGGQTESQSRCPVESARPGLRVSLPVTESVSDDRHFSEPHRRHISTADGRGGRGPMAVRLQQRRGGVPRSRVTGWLSLTQAEVRRRDHGPSHWHGR